MEQELITMTRKEIDRLNVIHQIAAKEHTQKSGAAKLGITTRQMRRIISRYRQFGEAGLVSRHRGKASNNAITPEKRARILELVHEYYRDFGPTLAAEKLEENHGETISREALRTLMINEGIWKAKSRKKQKPHQSRERRARFGELIQIDGSPHDWFEGRRPPCTLIVFIDDATGEFMELHFEETETIRGYATALKSYLHEYGAPIAFYCDKHGIFRINKEDPAQSSSFTQFGRMVESLRIEMIYASTPQAKGRVERANQTLQDRLVKELRLNNINTIAAANEFLKEYKYTISDKFAVQARSSENAHRKVPMSKDELDVVFSLHAQRKVSKNLEIRFENNVYRLAVEGKNLTMRGATVTVCKRFDGSVFILYKQRRIPCILAKKAPRQTSKAVSSKGLNAYLDAIIQQDTPTVMEQRVET